MFSTYGMTGRQWVQKQARDAFVQQSRRHGYVARSAFKLIELDDKFGLFRLPSVAATTRGRDRHEGGRGSLSSRMPQSPSTFHSAPRAVLDLGCSPGSWCQVLRERCGEECQLFALDLLPVKASVPNTTFIQGDFTDPAVQGALLAQLYAMSPGSGTGVEAEQAARGPLTDGLLDVVTSDMCPNRMGGTGDRQRQVMLQLEALTFSLPLIRPGGHFVCKTLGSRTSQGELWQLLSRWFRRVSAMKPLASREHSDEEFLVGRDKLVQPRPPPLHQSHHYGRNPLATGGSFGLDDWPGLSRLSKSRRRNQ